jgi:membrane protease YdiL (CAAX protease family)
MTRSGLVIGLYGGLALAALLISAGREDVDIYRIQEVSTPYRLVLSLVLGLVVGFAIVALSRLASRRFAWARLLHSDFRSLLGPLSGREILVLALASSIGEELLFRGALQPWIGIWPQALIFALLHVGPGVRFLPWTLSALVLGVLFGYMFQCMGDLGGPIVAHFTINYMNLHFIVRSDPPAMDTAPRPAG